MTTIIGRAAMAGVVLLLAVPAAAQAPSRDFERRIEEQARALAKDMEEHARAFVEAFEAQQARPRPPRPPRGGERGRGGPEVTERFSRTVRLDRNGTFDLSNVAGDIIVTGGGGADVQIDAIKRVRGRDEADGKTLLQQTQILISETGNRVEVRTEHPREERNLRGAAVDYTVALPQDASVILKTVSGDLRITNVRGELRAGTVSGDVQASGARRLGSISTVSGDIQITDAQAEGEVSVTTVSGDQNIRGLKARGLELISVSGELLLNDVEVERVNGRTVNGNITYSGSLTRNGRYELNTHNGAIALTVSTSGFNVEASTFNGDVRSDYALTLGGNQLNSSRRGPQNRTIRGAFGDGGASLSLRSFNGDISITRR